MQYIDCVWEVNWPQPENLDFPVSAPDIGAAERSNLISAFDSSWIGSNGSWNISAEAKLGALLGQDTALVSNGSVALILALRALGVGAGDEVIVPTLTYAATASSVVNVGATPVFADVELHSWQISIESIKKLITPKTRAIIAVHLYGQACRIEEIAEIAKENSLALIEDCAEATFSSCGDRLVGSIGDIATYSFFSNKLISCGEGGAVSSKNSLLMKKMKLLRGQGMDPQKRYYFIDAGYNFRLSNLHASILDAQISRLKEITDRREAIENLYREFLDPSKLVVEPRIYPNSTRSPWLFSVRIVGLSFTDKLKVASKLASVGIETRPVFYPLHENQAFSSFESDNCANAKLISTEGISLPTGNHLTEEDVKKISRIFIESIRSVA
jgi:perosamine synthetase